MELAAPDDVSSFVSTSSPDHVRIFFSERDGTAFPSTTATTCITAVVGPKGGWDTAEIEAAKTADFNIVTLGGRILRAETAAISLTAILQHRFGDLN